VTSVAAALYPFALVTSRRTERAGEGPKAATLSCRPRARLPLKTGDRQRRRCDRFRGATRFRRSSTRCSPGA
jgi:hypothetical protein